MVAGDPELPCANLIRVALWGDPTPGSVTPLDRRTFLATAGVLAARAAIGTPVFAAGRASGTARGVPLERIGLQLYTVRSLLERDFEGTLAAIADIGYAEVEFAGYFGRTPAQVRAILDRLGLTAPSTHVPIDQLGDAWPRTLEASRVMGHRYVTIPWIAPAERGSLDAWRRLADRFNEAGRAARDAGLRFAYHNHDFEFRPVEGQLPFDVLLERTDPALVAFELDLYWIVRAGRDPLAYLAEHRGRFPLFHVKDSAGPPEHRMVDVGAGTIDFATILTRAREAGGEHYFVEHDDPPDPLGSVRASHAALAALGR